MSAETVKKLLRAWEANDAATMNASLADDFVLSGPVPQPLGKADFVGFMHAMLTAFPDFKFNESNVHEQGDTVHITTRITGTHTGTLTLPGMPPIPATSKKITQPEEHQIQTLKGGKVHKLVVEDTPGGGVTGLLAQLGVKLG